MPKVFLEAARLFLDADFLPVLRSPLDWSVSTRLSEMGCRAVDVNAFTSPYEVSVSRPWLLEKIIHDSSAPVLLSGGLSPTEAKRWLAIGASAIVSEVAS